MRHSLKLALFISIICMSLTGCGGQRFSIEFALPADCNQSVRMMYYASDKKTGRLTETVAPLHGGKGRAEGATVRPSIVFVFTGSGTPVISFYVERGDKIKITGNSPDPLEWKVKGNKLSEAWSDWRLENIKALQSHQPERINEAVAKFVKRNPDNPLSTLLLLTSYDRRTDEKGYAKLWNSLGEKALDPNLIELVGRIDQPDMNPVASEKKIHQFVMASAAESGVDTIDAAKTRATILFFWHASEPKRRESIDTLRRLAKAFPDSTARNITDICLDSDSTSWKMSITRDSLRKTIRGWMPRGEADETAITLGVVATPLFIVADSTGRSIYRGDVPGDAAKAFRKLLKK